MTTKSVTQKSFANRPHLATNPSHSDDTLPEAMDGDHELNEEVQRLRKLIAEQARRLASMQALVETDSLTGLLNRRGFDREMGNRHAEWNREGRVYCVLMLDLDNFKQVNDSFGHPVGDQLLQLVAQTLNQNLRASDVVCRFGGDEFVIILPGTELTQAEQVMDRVNDDVTRVLTEWTTANQTNGQISDECALSVSIGVAQCQTENSIEQIVAQADQRMYEAKQTVDKKRPAAK